MVREKRENIERPERLVQLLRLVGGDQDAGRAGRAVDETERGRRTAVAEQPVSRSEHKRVNEEQIFIDEVVAHAGLTLLDLEAVSEEGQQIVKDRSTFIDCSLQR